MVLIALFCPAAWLELAWIVPVPRTVVQGMEQYIHKGASLHYVLPNLSGLVTEPAQQSGLINSRGSWKPKAIPVFCYI